MDRYRFTDEQIVEFAFNAGYLLEFETRIALNTGRPMSVVYARVDGARVLFAKARSGAKDSLYKLCNEFEQLDENC